jgi:hypothetical protein
MPLQTFHPVIQKWFSTTLGEPTDVQQASWPAIQSGKHALISAPTGSGKTLAAFLTCINQLLHQAIHGELVEGIHGVVCGFAESQYSGRGPDRGYASCATATTPQAPSPYFSDNSGNLILDGDGQAEP